MTKARDQRRLGHTLLEMLLVLSLISISTALAAPGFMSGLRGSRLGRSARDIFIAHRLAHWRSVVTGDPVRVKFVESEEGNVTGFALEKRSKGVWIRKGGVHRLPAGIECRPTGPAAKVFYPDGTSSIGGILLQGEGDVFYRLSLNPATGRVRLYRGDMEVGRGK